MHLSILEHATGKIFLSPSADSLARKQSFPGFPVAILWHLEIDGVACAKALHDVPYLGKYRLLNTLLIVLPIVFPPCILLANASSKAD